MSTRLSESFFCFRTHYVADGSVRCMVSRWGDGNREKAENTKSDSLRDPGPTVDGDYVPKSPYALLADGAVREVPFIIGNTKDE